MQKLGLEASKVSRGARAAHDWVPTAEKQTTASPFVLSFWIAAKKGISRDSLGQVSTLLKYRNRFISAAGLGYRRPPLNFQPIAPRVEVPFCGLQIAAACLIRLLSHGCLF
jgi:hypothetical protein